MAGGKKKKSSSAKKNKKSSANNSKPIQLNDVLSQAESAMEMSEVYTALKLFTYAAGVLRSRVHGCDGEVNDNNTGTHTNTIEGDKKTLATVLGKIGELFASNGDMEGARRQFLDAIEYLGPNEQSNGSSASSSLDEGVAAAQNCESRAGLHLYLGQLSCGEEALGSLRTGVTELEHAMNILEKLCEAKEDTNTMVVEDGKDVMGLADVKRYLIETRKQLCSAYCSIAELYLTDLCDEPDAESCCDAALQSALKLDEIATLASENINKKNAMDVDGENQKIEPPQPDALQTMANLRLSQSRGREAFEYIMRAYGRMKVGCEAMSSLVGLGKDVETREDGEADAKANELLEVDAASSLPGYEFRCQTAKIMLECASLIEDLETKNLCAESGIQVLGSLMAEDDEVIEVWYLLGCAFKACLPPNEDSAKYYWENALTMLNKVKEELESTLDDDEDGYKENELDAIESQIIEVQKKLGIRQGDGEDDDGDMDDC